jgi:hypothetical protein
MDWTTIKMSELMRQKTRRMDAGYWIKKKITSKKKATSPKRQASSSKDQAPRKKGLDRSRDLG